MEQELMNLLQEKAGLDPAKATQVVNVIVNFIKENPEKLTGLLGGGGLAAAEEGLGKLFGR
ncbi:MAG: hypothetical protein ACRDG3_14035 [Tepidiformaceae bacterium]